MSHLTEKTITTQKRNQFLDITHEIQAAVDSSGVQEGICVLHNPHTTSAFTINENADPDVTRDMTQFFNQTIPQSPSFRHSEGNSDSHIKTTLVGPSLTMIIHKGRLILGTWQGIYFCEFDGPRRRHYYIKCVEA